MEMVERIRRKDVVGRKKPREGKKAQRTVAMRMWGRTDD